MKRTILATLAFGVAVGLSGSPAHAEDTVRFGIAAEPYPPFITKDASGAWVGFEIDLMNAVCAELKADCELVETSWDGIIPALQEGKIDVIWASMSITDARDEVIDFTNKYYDNPAWIIGPKASDIAVDFENPESVEGKIIGVQTSTNHANFVQKYFGDTAEIKLYDTQDNANADLIAGRVDLVMAGSLALNDFLKSDQGGDMERKAVAPKDPTLGKGIGAGVRESDTELKERLNTAIKAVRESGTYDEIARKYFDFDIYGS